MGAGGAIESIRKNMRKRHEVRGKLTGTYRVHLASAVTLDEQLKQLNAFLSINEENSYGLYFEVKIGNDVHTFQSLSSAMRLYDNEGPTQ